MEELSYATVREFHRFADDYPEVTKLNEDLKSFQRPWCVDRLLKAFPNGGRILEIGADKCDLIPFLRAHNFEVWIIDVYDHFGGGTGTYDTVIQKFPDLPITRAFLHEDRSLPANHFDAVYSCSVIEHIPLEHIEGTVRQIERVLKPGGSSIHAIDCTLAGIMQNQPWTQTFIQSHHRPCDMSKLGPQALADLDTYYLSPQGHLNWRRFMKKTYDEYSYRRVTSIGFAATKKGDQF
ncbi:MAG TPA: methyltransferase domain-containing protein [Tepidisphaeraceae bacterium]|jgi:SAM-dependent methyltransferase|nr:methyltransferase domain-containing protein [Tepidisphaeraceae bacterium]